MASIVREIPPESIAYVFAVPRQTGLTPEQIRGAHCVWCATQLTAAAVDLGRRQGSYQGVYGPWFPRACDPCTRKEAARILTLHDGSCRICARPPYSRCPDRVALSRLAGEETR
ncbi:hypothetical protein [Streptomyces sp. NPDC001500]